MSAAMVGTLDWAKAVRAGSPHIDLQFQDPKSSRWVTVVESNPQHDQPASDWSVRGVPVLWRVKPAEQTLEVAPAVQTFVAEPSDMLPGAQAQYYARVTAIAHGEHSIGRALARERSV